MIKNMVKRYERMNTKAKKGQLKEGTTVVSDEQFFALMKSRGYNVKWEKKNNGD